MRWFEQFTKAGGPVVVGSVEYVVVVDAEYVVVVGAATVVAESVGESHSPQWSGHSSCVVGFSQSTVILKLSHWFLGRWSLQGIAASSSSVEE